MREFNEGILGISSMLSTKNARFFKRESGLTGITELKRKNGVSL